MEIGGDGLWNYSWFIFRYPVINLGDYLQVARKDSGICYAALVFVSINL